jgi:hypothetical protein
MQTCANDKQAPGGVYLCQIDDKLSCGACCGLYNVSQLSRPSLKAMLMLRRKLFARASRTVDGILEFKRRIESNENQNRPYPAFHHCPYIGLIGEPNTRVGCLLHPLAEGNKGIDYRGLSYYGGMACRDYFCPTHKGLKGEYKRVLRHLFEDWYEYGLIITEVSLLTTIFQEIERRLGHPLTLKLILDHPPLAHSTQKLCRLKLNWPFRDPQQPTIANYFFEEKLYDKPPVRLPTHVALFKQMLFRQLWSCFDNRKCLRRAEDLIDDLLSPFNGR